MDEELRRRKAVELIVWNKGPLPKPVRPPVSPPHLIGHLTEEQYRVLELLSQPLTIPEIADAFGPGYTSRYVETTYENLVRRLRVKKHGRGRGSSGVSRVALTRVFYGIDPCPRCEPDA
jgi:DNA-binding NarL/FixJ family response regulator